MCISFLTLIKLIIKTYKAIYQHIKRLSKTISLHIDVNIRFSMLLIKNYIFKMFYISLYQFIMYII